VVISIKEFDVQYTCRMHPEVISDAPGKCPKCRDCDLVPMESAQEEHEHPHAPQSVSPTATSTETITKPGLREYAPLLTIVALILAAAVLATISESRVFSWHGFMGRFMAGFFLVFGGFKLLDLPGFMMGYSTYDVLAKRVPAYGYVYPFLEVALGLALLVNPHSSPLLNWLILILMGFSSIGVLQVLQQKRKIQCACLGTVIKLPLTVVTLTEDLGMTAMAAAMLLRG
jgi:hypothetical protein